MELYQIMDLPEYTQESGLHVIECGLEPIVDIIAVHGLAANPEYTWIKKVSEAQSNGVGRVKDEGFRDVMWLKHLLPAVVPNARILKYNYDSRWLANAPKENLRSIGDRLIRGILSKREHLEDGGSKRPMIFIGHSFGGIVIEEVLLHAYHSERHRCIPLNTCGVIFLGTPFRGSSASSWGLTIANCASMMGFDSDNQLLKTLEEGSERLGVLLNDFTIMAKQINMDLVCFYELCATKKRKHGFGLNTIIVDRRSATLDGYNPISLPLDHSGLNKFGSRTDESFQLVSSEIKNLVNGIPDFLHSPAMQAVEDYERTKYWSTLPCAEGAAHNHRIWEHEDHCLPHTRVEIRQQIMAWSEDANGAYIFWLNGMAGTGKSTISRTIARGLDEERRLAASFFFSRGRADISHAGRFFTTIAAQLASRLPALRPLISKAIEKHLDIAQQGIRDQWKHLILDPLSSLNDTDTHPAAMVIVIDALDECEKEEDMRLILTLLAQARNLRPIRLQVFITSRPENPIRLGFRRMPREIHQDFVLHDIPPVIVSQDISSFFQHKFALVKIDHDGLSTPWPDEQIVQELVTRAAGLFIYAATTCRFIHMTNYHPEQQLSLILQESSKSTSPTKELDAMYTHVLRYSVTDRRDNEVDTELLNRFRQTVGSIVIMFDVMAVKDLAVLLDVSPLIVKPTLTTLRSVLNVPENEHQPIRTLHPSFRDFLLNKNRCLDIRFYIDEKEKHRDIFRNCLELMSKTLRRDMCGLGRPDAIASEVSKDRIQNGVTLALQYACRYWVCHFQLGTTVVEDCNLVLRFLNTHLLHWVEVFGLIGDMSGGIVMITALEAHLAVYYSALLFCPRRSIVRGTYRGEDPCVVKELTGIEDWSPLIHVFEGHTNDIKAVVFSLDRKLLASASNDKTVRLWDTSTGGSRGVLEGHSGYVNAVVFSPDGQIVASASDDKTVQLWDTSTGVSREVLRGHSDTVQAVVFSPDGKLVASASRDRTVRLWDASTGLSREVLRGHSDAVQAVVFSPDGKLVVSASRDWTVRIWHTLTGGLREVLQANSSQVEAVVFTPDGKLVATISPGHSPVGLKVLRGDSNWMKAVALSPEGKYVSSVCGDEIFQIWNPWTKESRGDTIVFSPDGKRVATVSFEGRVRLWDTSTRGPRGVFWTDCFARNPVVFSSDGELVASVCYNDTVRLWDTSTASSCEVLEGHSDSAIAVVFALDGRLVASASIDGTVRVWDTSTGGSHAVLEGHSNCVRAIVFSPDGNLIASASEDKTVQLWDASTGGSRGLLEGHSGRVNAVVFSPDGKLVISASDDGTVRLWDASTGGPRGVLEGHSCSVKAIVFSSDGKLIASASNDRSARLWDTSTRVSHGLLQGHSLSVNAVVFSPDGSLVASASEDKTVRLWDASTGGSRGVLEGHSDCVNAVAFSPDGKLVASASDDGTVRLWDTSTGWSHRVLEGHTDWVNAVVFSPDGELLASASNDGRIRLWDTTTGGPRGVLGVHPYNFVHSVNAVVFSPDGKLVASASEDKTVRLWDTTTGGPYGAPAGHSESVTTLVFSPDGRLVASASWDATVRLWDTSTGGSRGVLEGHEACVSTVAFSPDGQTVASVSEDKTVRLWDTLTGLSRRVLEGDSHLFEEVVFSPDGKLVASASYDWTVRLWDTSSGGSRGVLEGHTAVINAVVFSPDGKLLASASDDKTVRLWDASTGLSRGVLEGHSHSVETLVFSPDGILLASASFDRTVRLWTVFEKTMIRAIETQSRIENIKFSSDGVRIRTDCGLLTLPCPVGRSNPGQTSIEPLLDITEGWITYNMRKLFWLPYDYQCVEYAVSDSCIAFGLVSGHVSLISFDTTMLSREC